ncbi:MAG: hypothetical protein M1438_03780, partial [Deltaproteobacteria bacterium]|nr:hypothetical protein [Deltaproteobacteria bacterium]
MAKQFIEGKKPCIWMEAGVIDFKICDRDFDCLSCDFDRVMRETAAQHLANRQEVKRPPGKKAVTVPWEGKMRQHFKGRQKCQLMQTRHCHQCSFDELLEDQFDFFLAPERPK